MTKNKDEDDFKPYSYKNWIYTGLCWGVFMFVIMTILFPLFTGEKLILRKVLFGIVIWMVGGLGYGYSVHWFIRRVNSDQDKVK